MPTRPRTAVLTLTLLCGYLLGATAQAGKVTDPDRPRQLAVTPNVDVDWADPAEFSELKHSHNRFEAARGNWVVELARHLGRHAAERLPAGTHCRFSFDDIERAGEYERQIGSSLDHVRILRDIHPPRIDLRWACTQADGQPGAAGTAKLRDPLYLSHAGLRDADALRYEKRLLDQFLRRQFPQDHTAAR